MIVVFALCVVSNLLNAQERVNREKIHFTNQSEVLLNATGWAYNETLGEWIDYENVISHNIDYQTIGPTPYMKSHLPNFNSIQVKAITYNGVEYVCLIVNVWKGYYEYPEIMEDWQTYTANVYYFLSKAEYNKLFNLTNKITEIKGWSETRVDSDSYPEEDFVISKLIKSQQNSSNSWHYEPKTFLKVYKATDGNIRFLFKTISEYSIEKNYFETTENNWCKLKISTLDTNLLAEESFAIEEPHDNQMDNSNNFLAKADLFNFKRLPAVTLINFSYGSMEHGTGIGTGITIYGFHFEWIFNISDSGFGEHLPELGQWTGDDGYGMMFGYYLPLSKHIDIAPVAIFERYSEGITNGDNWWVSSHGVTNEVQVTLDSKKWSFGASILFHFTAPWSEHVGDCGIGLTFTNNYIGMNLFLMRMTTEQLDDWRNH
ncbi:MAG: hypothetical protein K5842_04395 [Bacteroidales bacterium]|nr:hypothetical protein [Bacteroidales bacterium]